MVPFAPARFLNSRGSRIMGYACDGFELWRLIVCEQIGHTGSHIFRRLKRCYMLFFPFSLDYSTCWIPGGTHEPFSAESCGQYKRKAS